MEKVNRAAEVKTDNVIGLKKALDSVRRNKLIDSLLTIRLALSVKKITSSKISKTEFQDLLNSEKEKVKDEIVKQEIDNLFKDAFEKKKEKEETNKSLSLDEMTSIVDNKINYSDVSTKENKDNVLKKDFINKNADKAA